MAGKSYTLKEMRSIVEYLTERKLFGEIKGRKMWVEFANSEHTTRTWQSLKETFLKRILPDLHNPYYKLTMDQVHSFQQGCDVVEKEKNNRLEFRPASISSGTDAESQHGNNTNKQAPGDGDELQTTPIDNEPSPTIMDNELETATGEDVTSAKIPSRSRSSADTVVLEYEDAEEQQELESPEKNPDREEKSKSYKDLLTFEYCAPLTPTVQELIQDFDTDSEASDKEPQLKIVENPSENVESQSNVIENTPSENCNTNNNIESVIDILDSDDAPETTVINTELETSVTEKLAQKDQDKSEEEPQAEKSTENNKSQSNQNEDINNDETNAQEQIQEICQQITDITNAEPQDTTESVTAESNAKILETSLNTANNKNENNNAEHVTQNTGSTSSDTILPNNQEALDGSETTSLEKMGDGAEKIKNSEKRSAIEAVSQDIGENKKQKMSDDKSNGTELHDRATPVMEIITDTPNAECNITSILENNAEVASIDIIEINTDSPNINKIQEKPNDPLKTVSENTNKSNTSSEQPVTMDIDNSNDIETLKDKESEVIADKNPCLLSVSLFDEQFKNTKYSDSDSDDEATPVPNQNTNKPQTGPNAKKEIETKQRKVLHKKKETQVIAKGMKEQGRISISSAEYEPRRKETVNKTKNVNTAVNLQKEKALSNLFGYTHGGLASTSRKRRVSHRSVRPTHHQHHQRQRHSKNYSNSSDWTSESDSESYVSPPRGRKSTHVKKYL